MKMPDGYVVIESIKQAFEVFAAMELPDEEQKCTISRESALALVATFEQVKRERDAAVEDLAIHKFCHFCAEDPIAEEASKCPSCVNKCNWQWRGVKDGDQQ